MTEQEKPAPLVPPDVDLRGLPFIPLDTVRLLDSDLFALSTGDEFKAAVALWCKSWVQVPASSVPNDDRVLAHLSGAGTRWKKVKAMAMRGWILCSDNRWYHRVVAEKAMEAWAHRQAQRDRAAKRWHKNPESSGSAAAHATASPTAHATAYPAAMQGTGTVKGQGHKTIGSKERSGIAPCTAVDLAVALRALDVPDANGSNPVVLGWAEQGVTVAQAQEACRIAQQDRQKPRPSVRYLDPIVQELLAGKPAAGASQTTKAMQSLQAAKRGLRE